VRGGSGGSGGRCPPEKPLRPCGGPGAPGTRARGRRAPRARRSHGGPGVPARCRRLPYRCRAHRRRGGEAAGHPLRRHSLHGPGHWLADGDGRSPDPGRPDAGGGRRQPRIAVGAPPAARKADEDPTVVGGSGLAGGSPRRCHRRSRRAAWRRGRGVGATHRPRRSIVLDHVVHQRVGSWSCRADPARSEAAGHRGHGAREGTTGRRRGLCVVAGHDPGAGSRRDSSRHGLADPPGGQGGRKPQRRPAEGGPVLHPKRAGGPAGLR